MTATAAAPKWVWRKPIAVPGWDAIGAPARALFAAADAVLAEAADQAAQGSGAGLERDLHPTRAMLDTIQHPLTVKFPPAPASVDLARSRSEQAVLAALAPRWPAPMAAIVGDIGEQLIGTRTFRAKPVATSGDRLNRYVVFPGAEHIEAQLARLDRLVAHRGAAAGTFLGTAALLAITNSHPFADANGRTSRIVFNLLTGAATNPHFYLPLYEIGLMSRGGYIVRARQAELRDEWEPIASYMLAATRLWRDALLR